MKSNLLTLVLILILHSCFFSNQEEENKFIGNWYNKAHLELARENLVGDSIISFFLADSLDTISGLTSSDSLEIFISLLKDDTKREEIEKISEYFKNCTTTICMDTVKFNERIYKFRKNTLIKELYYSRELQDIDEYTYKYDNDSLYLEWILNDTAIIPASYFYEFLNNDTLLLGTTIVRNKPDTIVGFLPDTIIFPAGNIVFIDTLTKM